MSAYNDMASDAGYKYGTKQNEQMARQIEQDEERHQYKLQRDAEMQLDQEQSLESMTEEIYRLNEQIKTQDKKIIECGELLEECYDNIHVAIYRESGFDGGVGKDTLNLIEDMIGDTPRIENLKNELR